MTDEEVHLLFVQNRWEKRCVLLASALRAPRAACVRALSPGVQLLLHPALQAGAAGQACSWRDAGGGPVCVQRHRLQLSQGQEHHEHGGEACARCPTHRAAAPPPHLNHSRPCRARVPAQWCKAPDQTLPAPDVVLFLQVSAAAPRACLGTHSARAGTIGRAHSACSDQPLALCSAVDWWGPTTSGPAHATQVSPDAAKLRGGYGGERYENAVFQEKVRGGARAGFGGSVQRLCGPQQQPLCNATGQAGAPGGCCAPATALLLAPRASAMPPRPPFYPAFRRRWPACSRCRRLRCGPTLMPTSRWRRCTSRQASA